MKWLKDVASALLVGVYEDRRTPPGAASESTAVAPGSSPLGGAAAATRILITPSETKRLVVSRPPALVVEEVARAAWDAKGWERHVQSDGAKYSGAYEVARRGEPPRRFHGYIQQRGHRIHAYVADPPESIRRHPKGPCFAMVGDGWFKVHWHRAPKNVDTAILYVERVLAEVLNA